MNPEYKLEKKGVISSGFEQGDLVGSCDHGNITS
jgi:hypothetical protein